MESIPDSGMECSESVIRGVERFAAAGARSVTSRPAVVQDAVELAVCRWEVAIISAKAIARMDAWAYRVGANAARKLLEKAPRLSVASRDAMVHVPEEEAVVQSQLEWRTPRQLVGRLLQYKTALRGRQFDVLNKMCQEGMTFRRAAKELEMARSNLRRSFRSGLARLVAARK